MNIRERFPLAKALAFSAFFAVSPLGEVARAQTAPETESAETIPQNIVVQCTPEGRRTSPNDPLQGSAAASSSTRNGMNMAMKILEFEISRIDRRPVSVSFPGCDSADFDEAVVFSQSLVSRDLSGSSVADRMAALVDRARMQGSLEYEPRVSADEPEVLCTPEGGTAVNGVTLNGLRIEQVMHDLSIGEITSEVALVSLLPCDGPDILSAEIAISRRQNVKMNQLRISILESLRPILYRIRNPSPDETL